MSCKLRPCNILFLMNGFGIEQLDSYNIYNAKLMPNLDNYTKTHLFTFGRSVSGKVQLKPTK